MKKVGIGCLVAVGVIAVVAVIAVVLAMSLTKPLVTAADRFFTAIRDGDADEAYAMTAEEFRASTNEDAFRAFLENSGISDYESGSWSSRSIENNRGTLEGSITTRGGGTVPVTIEFVKEQDSWKILRIDKTAAGVSSKGPERAKVPDETACGRLATEALTLLAEAVRRDDFSALYKGISGLWQKQTSPEALRDAFQAFVEKEVDLSGIRNAAPVFSERPALDADGVLLLNGYYPTAPARTNFRLKFVSEQNRWKLLALNVSLSAATPEE